MLMTNAVFLPQFPRRADLVEAENEVNAADVNATSDMVPTEDGQVTTPLPWQKFSHVMLSTGRMHC